MTDYLSDTERLDALETWLLESADAFAVGSTCNADGALIVWLRAFLCGAECYAEASTLRAAIDSLGEAGDE